MNGVDGSDMGRGRGVYSSVMLAPNEISPLEFTCSIHPVTANVHVCCFFLRATGVDLFYRACQLYNNISMLVLFPVKDGKLSTGVNATLMHHVTVSLQQSKITLQNNCINNTSITQPTLSFYL